MPKKRPFCPRNLKNTNNIYKPEKMGQEIQIMVGDYFFYHIEWVKIFCTTAHSRSFYVNPKSIRQIVNPRIS